ncbi:MAG: GNAT family N-acetyltransferase [Anaerolineae bacterium]|nr:GNAT family N-acetyltransferase [Anaerolineae bacterium]
MTNASEHFTIIIEDPKSLTITNLIDELDNELMDRYPASSVHILDLSRITAETGVFVVAYLDEQPIGCGAVCRLAEGVGEIKRVYVKPAARGQGISKAIMDRLESEALRLKFHTLRLETGDRQPESLGLYEKIGYRCIPNFGEYIGDPHSICMEKKLMEER